MSLENKVVLILGKDQQEALLALCNGELQRYTEGMTRREFLRRVINDINGAKPVSVLTPETLALITPPVAPGEPVLPATNLFSVNTTLFAAGDSLFKPSDLECD